MPRLRAVINKGETIKPIVFSRPYLGQDEKEAVLSVLDSGWIGNGRISQLFEEAFSEYLGGGYCVAVNSCTMALNLALRVSNIGEKKEVITTPLTFAATVNAIIRAGAKPVFADVDLYGNIDPDDIERRVTQYTAGIIPVHYTGGACNMGRISQIANHHNLTVIEDNAHGFGGEYIPAGIDGNPQMPRKLGTLGDFGCFSFHAGKNITAGEGGMVVTKRGDLAERIKILANQGQNNNAYKRFKYGPSIQYEIIHDGYKGAMSDINAAIGLSQLERWPEISKKRMAIFKIYEDELGLKQPGHSTHIYTILTRNRDQLRQKLHEMGIGTGIHYTPLHLEPGFKNLGYKEGSFPVAERIGRETVSLPVTPHMTEEDAQRVVKAVKLFIEN